MAAPVPNQLKQNGWLGNIPWAEYISAPSGTASEGMFSYGQGNRWTMTIMVNFSDTLAAINAILGTNTFNRGTGNLDRVPPLQHPYYWQLYASNCHLRYVAWTGKGYVPAMISGSVASSIYVFTFFTITFTQPRYTILDDGDTDAYYGTPRQEWQRWVNRQFMPQSDVIQRPGGSPPSFYYAEGPNNPFNRLPPDVSVQPFKNAVAQYLNEAELHFKWIDVPYNGLYSQYGIGPPGTVDPTTGAFTDGLLSCLNCVNNAEFLGYPAETLRLKTWQVTEKEGPIFELSENPVQFPPLYGDVDLVFGYKAPLVEATNPIDGSHTQHGWNAFPNPGYTFWSLATTTGALATASPPGGTLLPLADFSNIFSMVY